MTPVIVDAISIVYHCHTLMGSTVMIVWWWCSGGGGVVVALVVVVRVVFSYCPATQSGTSLPFMNIEHGLSCFPVSTKRFTMAINVAYVCCVTCCSSKTHVGGLNTERPNLRFLLLVDTQCHVVSSSQLFPCVDHCR